LGEGVTGVAGVQELQNGGMSLFLAIESSARSFAQWFGWQELLNGEEQIYSRYIQQVIDLF
jgi:hypothetical protein